MREVPTVGYAGLGNHHAEPYLQTLETLPVRVSCACAPTVRGVPAVDSLPDVSVYDDAEALLDAEQPDILWVSLPNRDTPAVIEAATDRGVDVFTEKPAGRTAPDLRPVAERVSERDTFVCPAYVWRGHPTARELQSRAAADFFGPVRHVAACYNASKVRYRDTDHYLFDPAASRGGILQWLGVHWLDLIPWLLNDPIASVRARVSGPIDSTVAGDVAVEDGATVEFETAGGVSGSLQCGYYLREGRYDTELVVYGEAGRAEWKPLGRHFGFEGTTSLELEAVDGSWPSCPSRTLTYEYEPVQGYGGAWGREYVETFLAARRGEADLPATLADAVTVLNVLDAAYRSADTGGWVAVGEG